MSENAQAQDDIFKLCCLTTVKNLNDIQFTFTQDKDKQQRFILEGLVQRIIWILLEKTKTFNRGPSVKIRYNVSPTDWLIIQLIVASNMWVLMD